MANRHNRVDGNDYGFSGTGGVAELEVCRGLDRMTCKREAVLSDAGLCDACQSRQDALTRQAAYWDAEQAQFEAEMAAKYGSAEAFEAAMDDMALAAWASGLS